MKRRQIMANARRKSTGKGGAAKPDLYEATTQKIVELMESGKLPWQQGWDKNVGAALVCPINGKSRHRYSRINSVYLSFIMAEKESSDPRFFTMAMLNSQNRIFRERVAALKEQGDPVNPELEWQYGVKKGAKSVLIQMSWKQTIDKHGNSLPEDEQYWAKRFCNVFHASDCVRREYLRDTDGNPILDADGKRTYKDHPLKPYVPKERGYTHEEQYEIAEGILKASGAVIQHDVPALDNTLPIPVTDTSALTLPPEALARGTARFYKYLLTERPADAGAIPKEHLYLVDSDDTAARYGAAYYEKQLPASVAAAYEMTPDYNYFANKSMHVIIYQRREADTSTSPLPYLNRDYEITAQANYVRTNMMHNHGLDQIAAHFSVHPPQEGRFLAEGDLIETDGRVFRITDVGFREQQLNAHKGDFVLTPLEDERVQQLRTAAQESVGEDTYRLYCDKIRETFYRAAQTDESLRAHPGIFVGTDVSEERERISIDKEYAQGFRERVYRNGLSSYTPTDEKGWQKADTEFAAAAIKASLEDDADAYLALDSTRRCIADAIQRNSPYAVISQDRSYGKQIVQNAERSPEIKQLLSVNELEVREPALVAAYSR